VRLRNLLREAQEHLLGHGLLPAEAGALLAPAKDLIADEPFWQTAAEGLAVFCAAGFFRAYRLPIRFRERAVVGRRFIIRPLLSLRGGDGALYILALSRNQVRLFEAREHAMREVELRGVPRSLAEALGTQETPEMLQFHTASPAGAGARPAIYSGGGTGAEDEKTELLRYCRRVSTALHSHLRGRTAPLLVAAAAPLPTLFREVSRYPYLLDEEIAGNPEHLTPGELHELGWRIVGPRFAEEQRQAAERFRSLLGTGRASSNLAEVVPAARGGRVDILFVSGDAHDGAGDLDEDLLETAAAFTLRNGGTTYEVASAQVPGGGPVAAVFRY
jgi:hypothetical protein